MTGLAVAAKHSKHRSLEEGAIVHSALCPELLVPPQGRHQRFVSIGLQSLASRPLPEEPEPVRKRRVQVISTVTISHREDVVPGRYSGALRVESDVPSGRVL